VSIPSRKEGKLGQELLITDIRINRQLDPDDDLTALAAHISEHGVMIPILVDHEYRLIDGLRRIRAIESLGQTTIDVVAVALHPPAMAWIGRARQHGVEARPLTPRRIWQLYQATRPLIDATRAQVTRGTQHGRGVRFAGREGFLKATGIDSESYLQAVTQIFRTSEEDSRKGQAAREVIDLVDSGGMSPYMALEHVRQRMSIGDIVDAPDQERVLTTVTSTLNGIEYGLSKLGLLSPDFDAAVLKDVMADLTRFRRTLNRLVKQLDKEHHE
jgi:hypothetical protein